MGYVDINEICKSSPITVMSQAESAKTSAPIDARGKNAVLVKITLTGSANWTIKLQGCFTRNGTYVDLYEQANTGNMVAMSHQTNTSKMILFKGIPDWIKIVATENADGEKCSIEAQLLNV